MIQALRNAFRLPDLRRKIMITFLILVIYRLASHVPVPNIQTELLAEVFAKNPLLSMMDMVSGGAMSSFSVMAMGVGPYITATIVMQLLQPIIPALEELAKEGEAGRNKINQYTYFLAIPLCALQAFALGMQMQSQGVMTDFGLSGTALLPTLTTIITMTAGTMFAIWLGELITEQGMGQGLSIIILGGIVARIPQRVGAMVATDLRGLVAFLLITAITVLVIVVVQEGQRRIPVQYGKRVLAMRGSRLRIAGGQSTHIPLRVNSSGMIPLIFAQSIMMFPGLIASYFLSSGIPWVQTTATTVYNMFNAQSTVYWVMYFFMVVGFTYFYTDVIFQQQDLAENLKRQGGFIPGIRPGKRTENYLNGVLRRITLVGAVFLATVAILPWLVKGVTETSMMLITSSGLLIVVGVVLDTLRQLEAQLVMRHYEGFIK